MNQENKKMGGQKGDISRSDRKDQQSQGSPTERDRDRQQDQGQQGGRQANREGNRQQTGGQPGGGRQGQQGGGMGQPDDTTRRDREDDR